MEGRRGEREDYLNFGHGLTWRLGATVSVVAAQSRQRTTVIRAWRRVLAAATSPQFGLFYDLSRLHLPDAQHMALFQNFHGASRALADAPESARSRLTMAVAAQLLIAPPR
jgi:hypothetical protein